MAALKKRNLTVNNFTQQVIKAAERHDSEYRSYTVDSNGIEKALKFTKSQELKLYKTNEDIEKAKIKDPYFTYFDHEY